MYPKTKSTRTAKGMSGIMNIDNHFSQTLVIYLIDYTFVYYLIHSRVLSCARSAQPKHCPDILLGRPCLSVFHIRHTRDSNPHRCTARHGPS